MSATDLTKDLRLSFSFIDRLCLFVEMYCIKEGVFRIPGDQQEASKIVEDFNSTQKIVLESLIDPLSVPSALKLYIRSHSQSLLGPGSWEELKNTNEPIDFPKLIITLFDRTTMAHKVVLRRILELLIYISDHQNITKMNPSNLG